MPSTDRQHRAGVALVIAAAIAWSTAPFFTRLLHLDSWTILFWRGLFGGGSIALFVIFTEGLAGARSLVVSHWRVDSDANQVEQQLFPHAARL